MATYSMLRKIFCHDVERMAARRGGEGEGGSVTRYLDFLIGKINRSIQLSRYPEKRISRGRARAGRKEKNALKRSAKRLEDD